MTSATRLDELPDELLLEIITHFACIQSFEPQSVAFKQQKTEKARQRENRNRELVLYALCLVSHRTRAIATPILYSSFVSCATSYSLKPLRLFHRTICKKEPALGLEIRLADCLQYVENRLADHLGNSLQADSEEDEDLLIVSQYFSMLADITKVALNLQHLNIVSLEVGTTSFWKNILSFETFGTCAAFVTHGYQKLQKLSFQIHEEAIDFSGEKPSFRQICSALSSVPTLTDLRVSSISVTGTSSLSLGSLEKLERVEITETVLEFEDICDILAACKDLRHISFHWAYLDPDDYTDLSDLYFRLLQHAETLRSLHVDTREVRTKRSMSMLGSLQPFASLESLSISAAALGFLHRKVDDVTEQFPDHRISSILPRNLEKLEILLHAACELVSVEPDHIRALLDLVADVPRSLPRLRVVTVQCPYRFNTPDIANAFKDVGVRFDTVNETMLETRAW